MSQIPDLFEHVLNFSSDWKVTNVEVDDAANKIDVQVKFTDSKSTCPDSGGAVAHSCPSRAMPLVPFKYDVITNLELFATCHG